MSPRQATLGPVTLRASHTCTQAGSSTQAKLSPGMGKGKTGREKPPMMRTKAERVVLEKGRGRRKTGQPVCRVKSRGTSGHRRRGWDEGIIIWGGDPRCLWAKSLSSGLCCASCHWAAQSPRDLESSLLAPHHRVCCHLLVRTQTATALAWLPWQNLGHPQGTLSLHKEEAVRESPGRC